MAVAPIELPRVWNNVRACLEIVRKRTDASWLPEDVYREVREGRAVLYVPFIDGKACGVLVLTDSVDRYTGERILLIWIAFSHDPRCIDPCLAEIDKMARDGDFRRIMSQSPRRGWIRRLRGFGYTHTEYVVEKRLEADDGRRSS